MPKRTCSIDGCDRPHSSRGWCHSHYMRWYSTGSVESTPLEKRDPGRGCQVDGCANKHRGRGYCAPHLKRFDATGDPGPARIRPRVIPADEMTYPLAHLRVVRAHGSAKNYSCVDCGTNAEHWSYDHKDEDERVDERRNLLFSTYIDHYEPRCVRCHWHYDAHHGRQGQSLGIS